MNYQEKLQARAQLRKEGRLRGVAVKRGDSYVEVDGLHEVKKGEIFKLIGGPEDPYLKDSEVCEACTDGELQDSGNAKIESKVLDPGTWDDGGTEPTQPEPN